MATLARHVAVLLVGGALLTGTPVLASGGDPTLVVYLRDYAGLPPDVLDAARQLVGDIYEAAGVRIVWADPLERRADPGHERAHVFLLSPQMTWRKAAAEQTPPGVLAQTPCGSHVAYVFVARVAIIAGRYSRPRGEMLGLVVAHELGHVLLPPGSHSHTGIMRDAIYRQRKESRFTAREAALMRERLLARAR